MSLTIEQFVEKGFGWTNPSPNSQKSYRNHITQFEAFLKLRNKTAQDGTVSDQDILEYVEYLKSKYQPNTVAVKVAAIKSYFKWLKKEGALTYKPYIRSLPHGKPTYKELEASDLDRMVQNMTGDDLGKQRDLAIFSLIMYCGFKTEEIVATNTENVDFDACEITVVKNRKPQKEKRSFRAASAEMLAYAKAKLQKGFYWKNCSIELDGKWAPAATKDKVEPFFLNRHHLRISGRSLRRRILAYLDNSDYAMRDFRHTYLKNLDRIVQMEKAVEA